MADLKIKVEDIPGLEKGRYVVLEGEIGPSGAPVFAVRLQSLIKDGTNAMLLDLTKVGYMNSTALASLIKLEDQLEKGYLGLVGIQKNARIVMDNLGITGLFHVHATRDEAIEVARKELGGDPAPKPEPTAKEKGSVTKTQAWMLFHPVLSFAGSVRPGKRLIITLSLRRDAPDPGVISRGVRLKDLATDWSEVAVLVKLESKGLTFDAGGNEGVVMLRRREDPVRCTLVSTVASDVDPGGTIKIDATFLFNGSVRGSACREVPVMART